MKKNDTGRVIKLYFFGRENNEVVDDGIFFVANLSCRSYHYIVHTHEHTFKSDNLLNYLFFSHYLLNYLFQRLFLLLFHLLKKHG